MATFRRGQRVKVRASDKYIGAFDPSGREGVVTDPNTSDREFIECRVRVDIDGDSGGDWYFRPESLVPLTDPKADEFLERIKKMKPYDEPVAPKVREPHPEGGGFAASTTQQ